MPMIFPTLENWYNSDMAKRIDRVPVAEQALFRRLDRHLETHEGQRLRRSRTDEPFGRLYTTNGNAVVRRNLNLEQFARELGLLRPWEELKS